MLSKDEMTDLIVALRKSVLAIQNTVNIANRLHKLDMLGLQNSIDFYRLRERHAIMQLTGARVEKIVKVQNKIVTLAESINNHNEEFNRVRDEDDLATSEMHRILNEANRLEENLVNKEKEAMEKKVES
jgi:hypothetical protein